MGEHEHLRQQYARANKAMRSPEVKAVVAKNDKAGFGTSVSGTGGMTVIRKGMSPDRSLDLRYKAETMIRKGK